MPHRPPERFTWDATAALEALGAADVALWTWDPVADRLRMTGAARALGLGPLAPECGSAALMALTMPQDREAIRELLTPQPPGVPIVGRLRMQGGQACVWRGVWLEEGGERAAGVIAAEAQFAATERDSLTGLLDRRSFVALARQRLQTAGDHTLVVADLDRLRRLNEALGHERADLVLAALGSRLAASFSREAVTGRVGEDEFALMVGPETSRRRRTSARGAGAAPADRGLRHLSHLVHRRGAGPGRAGRDGGRRTAAPGRAGRGGRQDRRPRRGGRLWQRPGDRQPDAAGAGGGLPRRHRARRDLSVLPADRASGRRRHLRLRGPGPLAPPPPRPDHARRLPAAGRRHGPAARDRLAHDERLGPPAVRVAQAPPRGRGADGERQPVGGRDRPAGPGGGRGPPPRRDPAALGRPEAGDHRKRHHARPGRRRR